MKATPALGPAALLMAAALASPAQAGWLGDSVTASFTLNPPVTSGTTITQPFPSGPVIVGAGVEFFGTFFNPDFSVSFNGEVSFALDLDDTGFRLGVISTLGNFNSTRLVNPLVSFSVAGLSPSGPLALTDYTCTSTGSSCTVLSQERFAAAAFDAQGVLQIAMNGLRTGETYRFDLVPQASVPAPAGVALFALGLLGLTALRRTAA
jgi:hypothetical protein